MSRFPLRSTLASVVVAMVLAGCSSGDVSEPNAAPTTTSAPPPPASPTTGGDRGCPAGNDLPAPTDVEDFREVSTEIDVDGDQAPDRLVSYRTSRSARVVGVELAAGGRADIDLGSGQADGPAPLSVLGGLAAGGEGDTVLVVTGAGASVMVVGLFQLAGCELVAVSDEAGQVVELPVGGGVTHGDGLGCTDDRLVVRNADGFDGETFTATETTYRVEDTTLVEVGAETTTLTRGVDDDAINNYYVIDCPTLTYRP